MPSERSSLIALDIGGTKIRGGAVMGSRVSDIVTRESPSREGANAMVDAIASVVELLRFRHSEAAGIAVATAGTVDRDSGSILAATDTIAGWKGVPLRRIIQDRFWLPAWVENDASAFTLGEALYGAGKGHQRVLGITIGTGIGAGLSENGRLLDDASAEQARAALMAVEGKASGRGLEERYDSETGTRVRLQDMTTSHDSLIASLMDGAATALLAAILDAADLVKANLVVLGGSLPKNVPAIGDRLLQTNRHHLPVVHAKNADDAPLLGIAHLWKQGRKAGE